MPMRPADNNMRAAYVHVLADAAHQRARHRRRWPAAIISDWAFSIPLAALVGAFVIASWAYGLIRDSAMVLLDADADPELSGAIKSTIEERIWARASPTCICGGWARAITA